MTRRWKTLLVATLVLVGPIVFAQEAKKPPAAAPPSAMPTPKPDAALDAYKDMIGSWKCDGKMTMGGQEIPMKSTAKFSWDVDNFWVVGRFESAKAKGMPQFKGVAYYGYDTGKKLYVNMAVDNMGGSSNATSKGREGDTEVWTGKASMMGKEADSKVTITYKGKNEVHLSEQMGSGPDAFSSDTTCKK
jgi:hypothetical protein